MNINNIFNFLKGIEKDSHGRMIEDIWNFSDNQLESVHNYIQWLFPLREMSENVMGSPYLDNEEIIEAMREDPDVQENILKSVVRMQEFYTDNDFWLQPNDHNHLRITRILKSLTLLSSHDNALEFHEFVLSRVKNFRPVTEESLEYWQKAVEG